MSSLPVLRIGRWELHLASDELLLDGQRSKIEPRLTRLLVVLAQAAGQVVDHPTLMAAVWAPAVVTPNSIYEAVNRLRAVLAADPLTPHYIDSVPRRGYRLLVPVSGGAAGGLPRLAVLPFRAEGLSAPLAPLRERLLEGLITGLAHIASCRVLARGTALAPEWDARALGVSYVLDGSLHEDGRNLVVQARLSDAASGELLASDTLRAPLADGPTLAQPVVERIARTLNLRLPQVLAQQAPVGFGAARQQAAQAWVALFCRPQSPDTNARAWDAAAGALQIDAGDAVAHASMAYAAWRAGNFGWRPEPRELLFERALGHVERALEIDPEHADAHFARALVALARGEFAAADEGMRHSARCAPSHAPAYGLLARMRCVLGHPEETAPLVEQAVAISPLEPLRAVWYWIETLSWLALGEHDKALDRSQRAIALNPQFPHAWFCAIAAAQAAGERSLCARWLAQLQQQHPQLASFEGLARISPADTGPVHTRQMQQYRALLRQAGLAERAADVVAR